MVVGFEGVEWLRSSVIVNSGLQHLVGGAGLRRIMQTWPNVVVRGRVLRIVWLSFVAKSACGNGSSCSSGPSTLQLPHCDFSLIDSSQADPANAPPFSCGQCGGS